MVTPRARGLTPPAARSVPPAAFPFQLQPSPRPHPGTRAPQDDRERYLRWGAHLEGLLGVASQEGGAAVRAVVPEIMSPKDLVLSATKRLHPGGSPADAAAAAAAATRDRDAVDTGACAATVAATVPAAAAAGTAAVTAAAAGQHADPTSAAGAQARLPVALRSRLRGLAADAAPQLKRKHGRVT